MIRIDNWLFCLALALLLSTGHAQVPSQINFQGQLVNANGSPLPDGAYALEFEIFDTIQSGTSQWAESTPHANVQVTNGVFSVTLGTDQPLLPAFADGGDRYIEVRFSNGGPAQQAGPRQQILSVPFAMNAQLVQGQDIAPPIGSLTAGSGLYANTIPDMTFSVPVAEFCFQSGALLSDTNEAAADLEGGNCRPGDKGFVLDVDDQVGTWYEARLACTHRGMRLPELVEFYAACSLPGQGGVNDMTGKFEYASNAWSAFETARVPVVAESSCTQTSVGALDNATFEFRCAR